MPSDVEPYTDRIDDPLKPSLPATKFNPRYDRFVILGTTLLYTFLYVQVYAVMGQFWNYIGFTLHGYDAGSYYIGYVFVAIASLGVRKDRRTIGEFIINVTFAILYLPCIMTPFLQGTLELDVQIESGALLTAAFLITSWMVHFGRPSADAHPPVTILEPSLFWIGFIGVWLAANLYVVLIFGANLRFASFADVYEQRFIADSVAGGGIIFYVILNLAGGINPFLISIGLRRRSVAAIAMGIASQLLMYSTSALKSIIASVFILIILHFALGRSKNINTNLILTGVTIATATGFALSPFYNGAGSWLDQIMSLVFMRTTMTPGVIYGIYLDFFSVYPTTHFSHVSVIRLIIDYPYGSLQIGQVVGQYLVNSSGLEVINVNANYLATDGVASFWLGGILLIGPISGAVFRLVDRLLRKTDTHLACVTLISVMIYLSNVSLFTAALTYGGVVAVGLLWLVPRSNVSLEGSGRWSLI